MRKKKTRYYIILPLIFIITFLALDNILGLHNVDNIKNSAKDFFEGEKDTKAEKDNRQLEINISEEVITTSEAFTNLLVITNKEINVQESSRLNLVLVKQTDDSYYYVLEITNIPTGDSSIKVVLKDEARTEQTFNIPVTRNLVSLPYGLKQIEAWPGSTYLIDGDYLLVPVSKKNRLLATYEPKDLVDLNKDYLLYTNAEGILLRSEAADYLKLMLTDLQKETNKNVVIASAYRSYNKQVETYSSWLRGNGQEEADKFSARPGYSEHQLGTVVDLISEDTGFEFTEAFDTSIAGEWLKINSYKYGFIQSLSKDSAAIIGYNNEPWHYRYIGVDNAEAFKDSGKVFADWERENQQ